MIRIPPPPLILRSDKNSCKLKMCRIVFEKKALHKVSSVESKTLLLSTSSLRKSILFFGSVFLTAVHPTQSSSWEAFAEPAMREETCINSFLRICIPSVKHSTFGDKMSAVQLQGNSIGFFLLAFILACFFQTLTRKNGNSMFESVNNKPINTKATSLRKIEIPRKKFRSKKWGRDGEFESQYAIDVSSSTYNREGQLYVGAIRFRKRRWGGTDPNWNFPPKVDFSKVTLRKIRIEPIKFKRKLWGGSGLSYTGKKRYIDSPKVTFKTDSAPVPLLVQERKFIKKVYGGDGYFKQNSDIKVDKSAIQKNFGANNSSATKSNNEAVSVPLEDSKLINSVVSSDIEESFNGDQDNLVSVSSSQGEMENSPENST